LIGEIFNDYNILSLLIYVIINIGLFIIFTFLLSVNFKKIIAKLQENKTRSNFVLKTLKTESIIKIFYMKELKRYLSSPIYVMNTFFGLIMIIGAAIATIFYDKTQILAILNMNGGSNMFQLLSAAVVFLIFLSSTTSASISLEGKNYWILKTLPIKPNKIYSGKLLFNLSLTLPIVYVSLIIFKYTLNLAVTEFIILILLATITSLVSSKFGLIVNLMFPKMDAINDVVIVKRSLSVMICVLLPMAVIFGITGLYSLISNVISFNIFIIMAIVLLVLMNLVESIILNTWGAKRFKEIN
jgi:ABC-2 type transport system permease protein